VKLGQFIEDKGADKLTVIAVDWLEGRYGADAQRLDRILRRVIHPRVFAVQGAAATSELFGTIESVPAYFLFDRAGRLVLAQGGAADEQNMFRLDTEALERVLKP
jgi:hypothetical protein